MQHPPNTRIFWSKVGEMILNAWWESSPSLHRALAMKRHQDLIVDGIVFEHICTIWLYVYCRTCLIIRHSDILVCVSVYDLYMCICRPLMRLQMSSRRMKDGWVIALGYALNRRTFTKSPFLVSTELSMAELTVTKHSLNGQSTWLGSKSGIC